MYTQVKELLTTQYNHGRDQEGFKVEQVIQKHHGPELQTTVNSVPIANKTHLIPVLGEVVVLSLLFGPGYSVHHGAPYPPNGRTGQAKSACS